MDSVNLKVATGSFWDLLGTVAIISTLQLHLSPLEMVSSTNDFIFRPSKQVKYRL